VRKRVIAHFYSSQAGFMDNGLPWLKLPAL